MANASIKLGTPLRQRGFGEAEHNPLDQTVSNPDHVSTITARLDLVEDPEGLKAELTAEDAVRMIENVVKQRAKLEHPGQDDLNVLRVLRDAELVNIQDGTALQTFKPQPKEEAHSSFRPSSEYKAALRLQNQLLSDSGGIFSRLSGSLSAGMHALKSMDISEDQHPGLFGRVKGKIQAFCSEFIRTFRIGGEISEITDPKARSEATNARIKKIKELEQFLQKEESSVPAGRQITNDRIQKKIEELTAQNQRLAGAQFYFLSNLERRFESILRTVTFSQSVQHYEDNRMALTRSMIRELEHSRANIHSYYEEHGRMSEGYRRSQQIGNLGVSCSEVAKLSTRIFKLELACDKEKDEKAKHEDKLKFFGRSGEPPGLFEIASKFNTDFSSRSVILEARIRGMVDSRGGSSRPLRGEVLAASNTARLSAEEAGRADLDFDAIRQTLKKNNFFDEEANAIIASQILTMRVIDPDDVLRVHAKLGGHKADYRILALATQIAAIPFDSVSEKINYFSQVKREVSGRVGGISDLLVASIAKFSQVKERPGNVAMATLYNPQHLAAEYQRVYSKLQSKLGGSGLDLQRAAALLLPEVLNLESPDAKSPAELEELRDEKAEQLSSLSARAYDRLISKDYGWKHSSKNYDAAAIIAMRASVARDPERDIERDIERHVFTVTEYSKRLGARGTENATNFALKYAYPITASAAQLLDLEMVEVESRRRNIPPPEDPQLARQRALMSRSMRRQDYQFKFINWAEKNFRDYADVYGRTNDKDLLGDGADAFFIQNVQDEITSQQRQPRRS